ncbi:bifunctional N(6)-L-threonylcarbamoyladenine synthase/serine/threonine protein kinase [Halodesulfurarchaeum formicicum]|uniref:Probable bifunctional tRNA threonylcarbamoyladenosine biosynthesis protein n=1 Tax=Halodesulfurarchaeum formicicum TaxID=1873524 RepID=A0A1J1AE50_9EURY|nr:bifunctional N6-L-threonylcarbamoyladenine synthase / protein kinase Bud32 [Halodesulfurarchaeum formicicum]
MEVTRILGIEGTAWAASAAVYDDTTERLFVESDAYQPASGGIHPREAAEHMRSAIPEVIETALDQAEGPIDAVAFSRGPGLGPCLRIVGTAARSLAGTLDVPLVGVNHMVAHLEIGRHRSGFDSPICLNASGANAHVLGFRNGRYRVLGETMDTGVGNAIDKFTRHVGWSHPGGPKVEQAAMEGSYIDLPYVVKGMDFSFSGIMSAAKDAYDEGVPVEDVSDALQETIFAMLTEVAERALSLTGRNELVLGGGVGQNKRLREMLQEMADQRGARFFAPEPELLRDNAGMIAVLGATMYEAGDTIPIADSGIDADFRPDQVPVTWRSETIPERGDRTGSLEGAEAVVEIAGETVRKRRRPKSYRHPTLDERLRRDRTVQEVRLTHEARTLGVPTPIVRDVDLAETTITFERVGERDLRDALSPDRARAVGSHLAKIHAGGFVHGDPTVRNVRVREGDPETVLIDFGLGYYTDDVEDYAMDLHVFEQSLAGTADDPESLATAAERGYAAVGDSAVIDRLREIEGRGRYQ